MIPIPEDLPDKHRRALDWFLQNEGQELTWPMIGLSDGTLVANIPKGIYKPEWSKYALSVKQTLRSPYADKEPTYGVGGHWSYLYYQEEQERKDPETLPSNRAMRECIRDGVPVGILRQTSGKPNVIYKVLGLARIIGKAAGYYLLEGHSERILNRNSETISNLIHSNTADFSAVMELSDTRVYRLRSVVQRQGQPRFREQLMELYERRCAISDCDVSDVLEAAHILPYRGQHTNDVSNGVILRADLHILFDEGLLAIDESSLSVQLAPALTSNKYYGEFHGSTLHKGSEIIDRELLRAHRHYCGF